METNNEKAAVTVDSGIFPKLLGRVVEFGFDGGHAEALIAHIDAHTSAVTEQAVSLYRDKYLALEREHEALKAKAAAPVKDHVIREVVNDLRDTAVKFHAAQQLRERLRGCLQPLLAAHSQQQSADQNEGPNFDQAEFDALVAKGTAAWSGQPVPRSAEPADKLQAYLNASQELDAATDNLYGQHGAEELERFKRWAQTCDGNCNDTDLIQFAHDAPSRTVDGCEFKNKLVDRDWLVWRAALSYGGITLPGEFTSAEALFNSIGEGDGELPPLPAPRCFNAYFASQMREYGRLSLATRQPAPAALPAIPTDDMCRAAREKMGIGSNVADHAWRIMAAAFSGDAAPVAAAVAPSEIDKMLETNQLDELGAEVARLQTALCFWLPSVTDRDDEVADRILQDAFLLCGIDGNLPDDFKTAQELGWIALATDDFCKVLKSAEDVARQQGRAAGIEQAAGWLRDHGKISGVVMEEAIRALNKQGAVMKDHFEIEKYGTGFLVADYSGNRGKFGAAYAGANKIWEDQPVVGKPFATKEEAEAWAETQ